MDPAAVQRLVSLGTLKVPAYVTFGKADNLDPQREATIEGGRPLSGGTCTSAYTIYNTQTLTRFMSTAGHCPGTLTYNNTSLPVEGQRWEGKYDYQWHAVPNTFSRPTNVIYEGLQTLLPITGFWPYEYMQVGDWLCKWGSATGWTCGGISNLSYNAMGAPGFVEVHHPDNLNLSNGGDSGAPWYEGYYQEAWGIHSDSSNINANDAFFMPVSYMSATGHAVLTSP